MEILGLSNDSDAFDGMRHFAASSLVLFIAALLSFSSPARAQSGELLRQGKWTVEAPAGNCGSLPLLQVKGPGTLFDSANASTLTVLQDALAAPLEKLCPGISEAILVNGRTRRLVRIRQGEQAAAAPSASAEAAPAPTAENTGKRIPLSTAATSNAATSPSPIQSVELIPRASSPPPVLPIRISMSSLSSAHGAQAKCDLLFRWLELGKTSAPAHRVGTLLPAQIMNDFRDDAMIAVFGKPYDALDNSARIELFEKDFSKCTGEARPASAVRRPMNRRPFSVGGVNLGNITLGGPDRPLPPEYRQEFVQYSELIHEAFGGRPGRFEPTAITHFLEQVRQQVAWANASVDAAAAASLTLDAFRQIQENLKETAQKGSMLRANERDVVRAYLARRCSDLAPAIVQAWLATASNAPKSVDTANNLLNSRREMDTVFSSLNQDQRSQGDAAVAKLLDSEIAPALQAETAKVATLRATWQGAQELGTEEGEFLSRFGQFSGTTSYSSAMAAFDAARTRIYPAVLPEWRKKVAAAQLQSGEIAALRDDLKILFVAPADRALPLFQQFEQPVQNRQTQLDARVAEDERQRLGEAERAAAAETRTAAGRSVAQGARTVSAAHGELASSKGPMPAGAFKVGGGPDAEVFTRIYEGAFGKINLDRSSTDFAAIGGGYVDGFSAGCLSYLPATRVQIMRTVCDEAWVTRNGWGTEISRTCTSSHEEGTGVFADPELYAALHSTPVQEAGSAMRTVFDMLTKGGDPISGPMNMALNIVQLQTDAQNLVAENGCTSPALRRFQQNLERFALGKEGIRLDGTVELGVVLLPPSAGTKYRDSDYSRLLDDMVNEQGKSWAVNRYIPGSIGAVHVDSRDAFGRPAKISADYTYNGFSSRQQGTLTLSFDDGRPTCLYFSDQPNSCRTPAHRLISAYVQGEYR